jgi:SAM-dependent methyltransferase
MKIENPAFDYDSHGQKYSTVRRTDPRIAEHIFNALGDAKIVLNVGAGAGSYEPEGCEVTAVEPSQVMRAQRIANGKTPAIDAKVDSLPFADKSFDASMAVLTIHHWPDIAKGLKEMRRVTKDKVVIMTYDPGALSVFWNVNYFPELIEVERKRYPEIKFVTDSLGGDCEVQNIPIPFDCVDGFQEAFYGRPEEFLLEEVRLAQSAWGFLAKDVEARLVKKLADELKSGEWDKKFGAHRKMPFFKGALRVITSRP